MMKSNKLQSMLVFLAGAIMILLLWYKGTNNPLSSSEVAYYINQIKAQNNNPGKHDLKALKTFLENDDGKAFYTVNLYQYTKKAEYADQKLNTISGKAAFDIFSKQMIKLLAQQGSHPIFGSNWSHAFTSNWDRIVIVRYRSRRDIAEIFINPAFTQASVHKWAAIKKNERLIVQGLHIPSIFPFLFIGLVLIIILLIRNKIKHKRE